MDRQCQPVQCPLQNPTSLITMYTRIAVCILTICIAMGTISNTLKNNADTLTKVINILDNQQVILNKLESSRADIAQRQIQILHNQDVILQKLK